MVLYCFSDFQDEEWYLIFCFSHDTFLGVVLLVLASVISIWAATVLKTMGVKRIIA